MNMVDQSHHLNVGLSQTVSPPVEHLSDADLNHLIRTLQKLGIRPEDTGLSLPAAPADVTKTEGAGALTEFNPQRLTRQDLLHHRPHVVAAPLLARTTHGRGATV
jgi:hypothetical protein